MKPGLVRRAVSRLVHASLAGVNSVLQQVDGAVSSPAAEDNARLMFLVGPPRSGSTLVYQVLVDCFDVGYLSNLHAVLYGMPTIAESLARLSRRTPRQAYESRLGITNGWMGPSEAGQFWYRFYPRPWSQTDKLKPGQSRRLQQALGALAGRCGRPFVLKNLFCTLRLLSLAELFPQAVFVVLRRGEVDIGHSLLAARMTRFGDYESWFSVPAPGQDELAARPPHEQVIEQVRRLYELIERQRDAIGVERFLDVSYDRFCGCPHETLARIAQFCDRRGMTLNRRADTPAPFARRQSVRIDAQLYERMVRYAHAGN